MSKLKLSTESIMDIQPYVPGAYAKGPAKRQIKLSSNENPFGSSPKVKDAIAHEVAKLNRYPEGTSQLLRERLGEFNNIDSNRIICGAGSDELITLITLAFAGDGSEVIYTAHGFLMYPINALSVGAKPVVAEEKDLKADVDAILNKVTDKTRIVFLANPNNPTGSYLNDKELSRLVKGLPKNILLVLDLAYAEYVTANDYPNAVKIVDEFENVIMLRTFSKAYGIPGLRLGWAYSTDYIIDILNRVRGPFNVSTISQAAGIAALSDQDFVRKSVSHNQIWLNKMTESLMEMGVKVYPSVANFILTDFGSPDKAAKADAFLKNEGISVRRMDAYKLPSCLRITIGLEDENKIVIESLSRFMDANN